VLRIGGQVRTDWGHVTGWDFTAALAMARALGVPELAVAEFLPWIEAEMVKGRAARRAAEAGTMPEDD
jgi:hypothetical protein